MLSLLRGPYFHVTIVSRPAQFETGHKDMAALGNNIFRRSKVPNEPSISLRSFRRLKRRRAWQRSRTPNKQHVDSENIEE